MSADDLPYRPCVGIMVLNDRGLAWAGRRIVQPDTDELSGATQLWQMPQGGVDRGEDPREAAYRELYEETGIKSVSFLAETPEWITYDLPEHLIGVALKGKYRGQKQKWFALRFEGDESEIDVLDPGDGDTPEFSEWRWEKLDRLPDLIVPFKRQVYEGVVSAFADIP